MNNLLQTDLSPYVTVFYEQITFMSVVKFMIVYFFIIWIALIIWVIKDITNRTSSVLFQIFCIFLIFVGTPLAIFIYLLIRPGKTLFEKYHNEVNENLDIMEEIIKERNQEFLDNLYYLSSDGSKLQSFKKSKDGKNTLKTDDLEVCSYSGKQKDYLIIEKNTDKKSEDQNDSLEDDILEIINHVKQSEEKIQKEKAKKEKKSD